MLAAISSLLVLACCSTSTNVTAPPTSTVPIPAPTTTVADTTLAPASSTTFSPDLIRDGTEVFVEDTLATLTGRTIGLVTNQTARYRDEHLIDIIHQDPHVTLAAIFAPEHGLRGDADAGALIDTDIDATTGVVVHSLYGATKEPTAAMLSGIDLLVFDIQDVGCRFYTYISTLGLVLHAAALHDIDVIVVDHPNPNVNSVAGYTRTPELDSFVSAFPVPSTYGMTIGELAHMMVGEGWVPSATSVRVIAVENYQPDAGWPFEDWIPPSPGLPTEEIAHIYAGTVLFEATSLSLGRGTDQPFAVIGSPSIDPASVVDAVAAIAERSAPGALDGLHLETTTFRPLRLPHMATEPRFSGVDVPGVRLRLDDTIDPVHAGLTVFLAFHEVARANGQGGIIDRPAMFDLLAGSSALRRHLDKPAADAYSAILADWTADRDDFLRHRDRYLLYERE